MIMRIGRARCDTREDNPDGGQWTSDGNSIQSGRVRLAGALPTNDTPEIPNEKPPTTRERNRIARAVARWMSRYGGRIGRIVGKAYWLYEEYPNIRASLDSPKTLEELRQAVSNPQPGYETHHIVEQGPARSEGFPESLIESRENKVLISKYKHWDISTWYSTPNEKFGGASPRDYLRGKSWDERTRIGLQSLVDHGVLKP
jgi:hypothetical protein